MALRSISSAVALMGALVFTAAALAEATDPQVKVNRSSRDIGALTPCLDLRETHAAGETAAAQIYRVRAGDTLSGIATHVYRTAAGYQSIVKYHNAAVASGLRRGDHPAIGTDNYIIYVGRNLHLPPRGAVDEAAAYVPFAAAGSDRRNFELPGSGSVYPLVVTAANCLAHADELSIPGMQAYEGTITLLGPGTGFGRDEYCRHRADAYMASDRAKFNEVTDCAAKLPERRHLEIAVARDAVVVVVNKRYVDSDRGFDTARWPGYVNLTAEETCGLLTNGGGRSSSLHFSTAKSGTLRFVSRRICGNEASLVPHAGATEDYQDIAFRIAGDPRGVGFLPYAFYYAQRERLVPVAIDGVRPLLELAKPELDPTHNCHEIRLLDKYSYCLSRYLWIYADRDELLRRGGLFRMLHLLLGAPGLIERAHYLPLTAEMRQAELNRILKGK